MCRILSCIFFFLAFHFAFSQNWKQIGVKNPADIFEPNPGDLYPYGIGIIWDLKFEPQYDGQKNTRLYATGVSSGLWLSASGKGNDWQLLNTDFLPESSIGDFSVDPRDRNKIIIGTGLPKLRQSRNKDLFNLPMGKGIFQGTISKKNKVSWQLIPDQNFHDGENIKDNTTFWSEHAKCVGKLSYSPDGSILLLAVIEEETPVKYHTYIYKSVNGGTDWFLKLTLKNLFIHDLDFNPTNQKNIILSCSFDSKVAGHIFESKDKGETWNAILRETNELNMEGCFYKTCFDNETPSKLWFCRISANSNDVFIRSKENEIDLKQKFRQWHNAGLCSAFAISGFSNDFFSTASVSLNCAYESKFQNMTKEMHSDIRCIAYYPKSRNMVVANDGGVSLVIFDTVSKSYTVSDISNGLEIGRLTNISSASKYNFGFSNWDNSCRWVNSKTKGYTFFDLFGNESTIFEMNDSALLDGSAGPTNAILYLFDSSFTLSQREIYYGDFFTFIPHQRKFLYVNGTQLHKVNYSTSHSSDSIIYTHPQGDKSFLQPRVAAVNPDIIYTATQQQGAYYHFQVFKSLDGGTTWKEFNTQPYGGYLTDIAIDPNDADKICVGSTGGEVFFSENSGETFTNSMMPPEAGAINTLTYINSKWVLAASDHGLWICNTNIFGDKTWRRFNDILPKKSLKLPDCRITDVEYLPGEKIIRAATMGRGAFECDVKKLF